MAISLASRRTELWRTDESGHRGRRIANVYDAFTKVILDEAGDRLFLLSHSELRCRSASARATYWRVRHRFYGERSEIAFDKDFDRIVIWGYGAIDRHDRRRIDIYDADKGELIDQHVVRVFNRLLVDDGDLVIEFNDGMREPLVSDWVAKGDPDASSRAADLWDSPQSIVRLAGDRRWSTAWIALGSLLIGAATALWGILLVFDTRAGMQPWRSLIDLGLIVAMLTAVALPVGTPLYDPEQNELRALYPRLMLYALGQLLACSLLVRVSKRWHFWLAVFVCASFPLLLLPAAALLFVRWRLGFLPKRSAESTNKGFRFGIAEMLLLTAAIAVGIQLGGQAFWLFWVGLPVALHMAVSYLAALEVIRARGFLVVTVFLAALVLANQQAFSFQSFYVSVLYLVIVPLVFAVVGSRSRSFEFFLRGPSGLEVGNA